MVASSLALSSYGLVVAVIVFSIKFDFGSKKVLTGLGFDAIIIIDFFLVGFSCLAAVCRRRRLFYSVIVKPLSGFDCLFFGSLFSPTLLALGAR